MWTLADDFIIYSSEICDKNTIEKQLVLPTIVEE